AIDAMALPGRENRRNPLPKEQIKKGTYVYIDTLDSDGTITKVSGNKITIACGLMHVTVTPEHCFETKKPVKKVRKPVSRPFAARGAASVRSVHTTLNVIGKTVDEAVPEVDRFLNECFMAGVSPVQIIHGKGTGALRQGIQEYLRTLNFVKEFHEADYRNGGAGVTEVFF
ncbi:MAG: Smr/MutS family protein, partial [Dialister sp.]|nr:Smr/MutS family protein [Dialister sp.]